MTNKQRCISILALAAMAYFVAYPEDAQAITTPIASFLNLTTAVSPWLYAVVAVGIIARTIAKTQGDRVKT